jgi:hypothetical protein
VSLLCPLLLLIGAGKDGMNGLKQARAHAEYAISYTIPETQLFRLL